MSAVSATRRKKRATAAATDPSGTPICRPFSGNYYRCEGCDFRPKVDRNREGAYRESMRKHFSRGKRRITNTTPKRPVKPCAFCLRDTQSPTRHIQVCHQSSDQPYRCKNCGSSGFKVKRDFDEHVRDFCSVKNSVTGELFEGWIWTKTNPSIPVRRGSSRPELPAVVAAAGEAIKQALTSTLPQFRSSEQFNPDGRSEQSPPVVFRRSPQAQQPLPSFEELFVNPASTNLPRYDSYDIESNQIHQGPWTPHSYPLSTTDFASLPNQLSPSAPFYPDNSFISIPPTLPSHHSDPPSDPNPNWHHYDSRTNQFHSDIETVLDDLTHNHSLAKHLSPRQFRRYRPISFV